MVPGWLFITVTLIAAVGFTLGLLCALQLYKWERLLRAARIVIYFKGRSQMSPRLIDVLIWAQKLQGDARVNGQVIYKGGQVTVALKKPDPRGHGKTTTTVKEKRAA